MPARNPAASLQQVRAGRMQQHWLGVAEMDYRGPVLVLLALIGCVAAPASAATPHGLHLLAAEEERRDLDSLPPEELDEDLTAELADVFEQLDDPNAAYPIDELYTVIMAALSDDNDDGAEDEISQADLEAEMEEAGTDLQNVVMGALRQADTASIGTLGVVKASTFGLELVRAGAVRTQFAVSFTKRALENTVRAAR